MTHLGQRLADEQQITTPREFRPRHYSGITLLWTLFKIAVATVVIFLFMVGMFLQ